MEGGRELGISSVKDRVELSLTRDECVGLGSSIDGGRGGREGGKLLGPHLDRSEMHSLCM